MGKNKKGVTTTFKAGGKDGLIFTQIPKRILNDTTKSKEWVKSIQDRAFKIMNEEFKKSKLSKTTSNNNKGETRLSLRSPLSAHGVKVLGNKDFEAIDESRHKKEVEKAKKNIVKNFDSITSKLESQKRLVDKIDGYEFLIETVSGLIKERKQGLASEIAFFKKNKLPPGVRFEEGEIFKFEKNHFETTIKNSKKRIAELKKLQKASKK